MVLRVCGNPPVSIVLVAVSRECRLEPAEHRSPIRAGPGDHPVEEGTGLAAPFDAWISKCPDDLGSNATARLNTPTSIWDVRTTPVSSSWSGASMVHRRRHLLRQVPDLLDHDESSVRWARGQL